MKDNNENTQHAELFCPKCGENIISMSVHYCATPPAERPTTHPGGAWSRSDYAKAYEDLERQLAEAREELADWKDAAASAENPHPDEIHCACVPMLRGALAEARKQRDRLAEALETLKSCHLTGYAAEIINDALASLKGETDESR